MPQKVIVDKSFLIKQVSIFSDLAPYQIESIAKKAEFFEYKRDELVYNEGDTADAFYLIISGRARVYTTGLRGEVVNLEYLHRGSYFGIISLLTNEPHSVSAQIVNDSLVLKIVKEDFYALLKTLPQLAVHFSSILARRLKRKEFGQKTVFESTIISVYGAAKGIGSTLYALNLAKALYRETKKNIILLDMAPAEKNGVSKFLELKEVLTPVQLTAVFFDEAKVKNSIVKDESGINILRVPFNAQDRVGHIQIISLLSYLTNIFDYCVVDVPANMGEEALHILAQSDKIHFLSDNQNESVNYLNTLIAALERLLRDPHKKIKIILSEWRGKINEPGAVRYGIYATLPDMQTSEQEYQLAVRRIAREIGEVIVGIALGSGGAWGLSLIGVIKVLEKEGIPVDVIAGSSMGALIGAFWAAGYSGPEMERIAIENKKRLGSFSFKDLKFPVRGLLSDIKTLYVLRKYLANKTFQDIKCPLKIVATSLEERKEIIIETGDLTDAIRASISIPGIYSPVKYKDQYLIDGGIVNPVPVSVLLKMNARKIIAINTLPNPEDIEKGLIMKKKRAAQEEAQIKNKGFVDRIVFKVKRKLAVFFKPNILEIITDSIEALECSTAEANCRQADIVIHPSVGGLSWRDFLNPETLISLGEEACSKALPDIKRLILEED